MQVPARVAGYPAELYSSRIRQIALCDFLTRSFGAAVSSAGAGDYEPTLKLPLSLKGLSEHLQSMLI